MCGISGIKTEKKIEKMHAYLRNMIQPISNRGPDDSGIWYRDGSGLVHARLSIQDLTQAGKQPMFSSSKKWIVVFNGEIYNFLEIRASLQKEGGILFYSNSDTEVLINAIELWGIEKTLKKCTGMFAFSAYDLTTNKMYLARDRFGEKPLYYGEMNNVFAFSSELKSFKALVELGWDFSIDRRALATYMRFGYVPSPYSIYQGISKLDPGNYLVISENNKLELFSYWEASSVLHTKKFSGSYEEAVDQLECKLREIIKSQMMGDVPLGAFLSGGIDSSVVVALMQSIAPGAINTFSVGFQQRSFNEAEHARKVAEHLGTNHTSLYIDEKDALSIIPNLAYIYDEPFADSSQIPTHLVSKLAKKTVKVSLSGDGADELFGGYNRYFVADYVKNKILDNHLVKLGLLSAPACVLGGLGRLSTKYSSMSEKLIKLKKIVRSSNGSERNLYKQICSQICSPGLIIKDNEYPVFKEKKLLDIERVTYQEWMMLSDSKTYLSDDILTKVDRAAMAVSLETRTPFLDHGLYEFAWNLPIEYKISKGVGKRVLRDVLYRYVPKKLVDRPKMGFGVPLASWLRGELKEWAESLLQPSQIQKQGYLNSREVSRYWVEHQSGRHNWQAPLWNILMFQSWLDRYHG
jgi:asparagine synthase (glutamine-hydrolysing)